MRRHGSGDDASSSLHCGSEVSQCDLRSQGFGDVYGVLAGYTMPRLTAHTLCIGPVRVIAGEWSRMVSSARTLWACLPGYNRIGLIFWQR